jgi:hypothetical protein
MDRLVRRFDNASPAVSFIGGIAGTHLDFYNWRNERSIGSFDISQRAVISYIYELPFGRNKAPEQPSESCRHVGQGLADQRDHYLPDRIAHLVAGITNNTNIGTSSQRANNNGKSAYIDHSGQSTAHSPCPPIGFTGRQ